MDDAFSKTVGGKCLRPVRNRRYSRKSFAVGQRPAKRLFTPEIKRSLKEWLIRRRENPYPNRDEKKNLAAETGLTYIQICNWFANWRRKLKNAGNERHRKTWGHLIKTYNNHAQGNVEQFSICSDDSIWGEPDPTSAGAGADPRALSGQDHCYTSACSLTDLRQLNSFHKLDIAQPDTHYTAQCYHVSSTTEECKHEHDHEHDPSLLGPLNVGNKYKSHIMEKYLRGLKMDTKPSDPDEVSEPPDATPQPVLLTKWLESAAKFQPCQSNYVTWDASGPRPDRRRRTIKTPAPRDGVAGKGLARASLLPEDRSRDLNLYSHVPKAACELLLRPTSMSAADCDPGQHGREEVEAAVTLTRLASLYRS